MNKNAASPFPRVDVDAPSRIARVDMSLVAARDQCPKALALHPLERASWALVDAVVFPAFREVEQIPAWVFKADGGQWMS